MSLWPTVIHDGEDFVLHHNPGCSNYLLVTFIGSHQEGSAAEKYLLREFAEQNDVSCLGISCKTRNFYVSNEMERVLEVAAPILQQFKTIVVIGNSIGGYAAIKFSRRLNATHVLAMAPLFSLDPQDPLFVDQHERSRLQRDHGVNGITSFERFQGMAIGPQDVSGRIFVLYNPLNAIDAYQMKHLRNTIVLEETSLQQGGHDVFPMVAQSKTMLKIIDLLRTAGAGELRREFRAIKRTIPECIMSMMQHVMVRHPLLVHKVLNGKQIAENPALRGLNRNRLSNKLAYHLAQLGHKDVAFERVEALLRERLGKPVPIAAEQDVSKDGDLQPGRHYLLMSANGTFLSAANGQTKLSLCWDPFTTDGMRPVFASVSSDGLVLQTLSRDGEASRPFVINEEGTKLDWAKDSGLITLRTPSGLIAGSPYDVLRYGDKGVTTWARFLPIAVSNPAVLIQKRANEWLEAASTRATDIKSAPARSNMAQPPRSTGTGWSRLFKFAGRGG